MADNERLDTIDAYRVKDGKLQVLGRNESRLFNIIHNAESGEILSEKSGKVVVKDGFIYAALPIAIGSNPDYLFSSFYGAKVFEINRGKLIDFGYQVVNDIESILASDQ